MKHISVKMSDEEYHKVMKQRGDKTTSEYVRELLFSDHRTQAKAVDLRGLLADVSAIRAMMETALKNNSDQGGGTR